MLDDEQKVEPTSENGNSIKPFVSGSLPNWWDLHIIELEKLEQKIKQRLIDNI